MLKSGESGVASGKILTVTMAGYVLGRLHFKGKELAFSLLLFQMMVPAQIFIIPQYLMVFAQTGLYGTSQGFGGGRQNRRLQYRADLSIRDGAPDKILDGRHLYSVPEAVYRRNRDLRQQALTEGAKKGYEASRANNKCLYFSSANRSSSPSTPQEITSPMPTVSMK